MRNSLGISPAFVLLLALLGGCAATPEASRARDADAKRFETAPNAAIIYLYRPAGYGGAGISTIWIDNKLVGETLPTTFFRVPVRPGRNRITASGADLGRLEIETKAEGVYFVQMIVEGSSLSNSRSLFNSVEPEIAKTAIRSCCRMLEEWRPGQSRLNF